MVETQLEPILGESNQKQRDNPCTLCIHQLFEQQVETNPNAVAVSFEEQSLTYGELNARANQLAHDLSTIGVKPETLVGICVERSIDMIVGLLSILKAGGAYLPLDPAYPKDRLEFMVEDAQISVLVTQEKFTTHLPLSNINIVCLDGDRQTFSQHSQQNPKPAVTVENLAYILYTSGSTGLPKGVLIPHKALVNLATAEIKLFNLQPSSRVIQFASINFDVSVSEIFTTLCAGAQLCLGSPKSLLPGGNLLQFLQENAITHAALAPSVLAVLPQASLPQLQVIIAGGEACPPKLMEQWAVGRRFLNAYGPTEATVEATVAECSPGLPLTIGRPLANTEAYILDESLQQVSIGVAGELHIGGIGLARGYLNRPELTESKFIPHPFSDNPTAKLYKTGDLARYLPDGNIEYLGRIDHQVKIRGFRVELGEIEAIFNENPVIQQAVVIARPDQFNDTHLVAYAVLNAGAETDKITVQWRNALKEKLPDYMIPEALVILEKLPLTPNDKVDRLALAKLPLVRGNSRSFTPPRHPEEEVLTRIWAEVLGLEQVGIEDNFFDLGGHSLKAVALCNQLSQHLNQRFTIETILDAPTVANFANYLRATHPELIKKIGNIEQDGKINVLWDNEEIGINSSSKIDSKSGSIYCPLSFTQQKRWTYQKSNSVIYYSANFRRHYLKGELNLAALTESFNEIIRRHQPLRTTFREVKGSPVQVIAPSAEVNLSLIDIQHFSESSKSEEVERLSEETRHQPFDLENGPLMRVTLIRWDEKIHILLVHIHDILMDNSSFILFYEELSQLYDAFSLGKSSPLTPLSSQYIDYVNWQLNSLNSKQIQPKLNYCKKWLAAGEPPELKIPFNRVSDSAPSVFGSNEEFEISADLTQKLKRFSQQQKTTLFMTALAAYATLLYRYSGCEEIVIRTPHDARDRAAFKPLIGLIGHVVLFRIDLRGNPSFLALLTRVRQVVLEALEHQNIPFEQLAKTIKPDYQLNHSVFKAVAAQFPKSPEKELKLSGLDVQFWEMEEFELRPDLELAFWENTTAQGTSIEAWWQYKKDYFDPKSIATVTQDFLNLLEEVVTHPEQPIQISLDPLNNHTSSNV
jgi:amino acid adenylation domain-containing protein